MPRAQRAYVTPMGRVVLPSMPEWMDPRRKQESGRGENFAEDDPQLPRLERQAEKALLGPWRKLGRDTLEALGLRPRKAAEEFVFDPTRMAELLDLEAQFVRDAGGEEGRYARSVYQAWLRGVSNAASELDADMLADRVRDRARRQIAERGLELVQNGAIRRFREGILQELQDGVYDGLNPRDVARKLRRRFAAGDYNWERLARSEITQAQVNGKEQQYLEEGIEEYDYLTSNDFKVSAICRRHQRNNPHPVATGPKPVRDSHPGCRCTIAARIPGD